MPLMSCKPEGLGGSAGGHDQGQNMWPFFLNSADTVGFSEHGEEALALISRLLDTVLFGC